MLRFLSVTSISYAVVVHDLKGVGSMMRGPRSILGSRSSLWVAQTRAALQQVDTQVGFPTVFFVTSLSDTPS